MSDSRQQSESSPSRDTQRLRRRALGDYRYVRLRWRLVFGLIDAVGTVLFAALRLLCLRRPSKDAERETRRILLVQFDHLGDAVITTAVFGPLRQHFPNARIEVLTAPWNRAVFESVPEVDRVHVCRHNRFANDRSLAWIPATLVWGLRMRQRRFDLAIDVRGEFPHNVLLWLSGAPRRVGWASGGGGFLLTDRPTFVIDRPEIDSRAALLECLDIQSEERLQSIFYPSNHATRTAETAWNELKVAITLRVMCARDAERDGYNRTDRPLRVVFHVGAGTSAKRWPAEHWRRLLERLSADGRAIVGLVGTANDSQTARAILGSSPSVNATDWTGRFTVDELAAVLQQADVVVGADSGPAHLTAAVGTPVVTLFSGTNNIEQWQPRGPSVRMLHSPVSCAPCHQRACPLAEHPCMRGIHPDDVMSTLTGLLPEQMPRDEAAAAPTRNEKGLTK